MKALQRWFQNSNLASKWPINLAFLGLLPFFFATGGCLLYTSDSGAYLMTAQSLSIPLDRSVFYSLYLRGLTDLMSLFTQPILGEIVVLPPLILLFVGIFQLVNKLFPAVPQANPEKLEYPISLKQQWIFLAMWFCAFFLTPMPWFLLQAMPDIFTAILCIFVLLFLQTKSLSNSIACAMVILVAAIMHNANLITLTIVGIAIWLAWKGYLGKWTHPLNQYVSLSKTRSLLGLSFVPWALLIASNIWGGQGFTVGKGSHVFFMGKLCENGILKTYLDDECASKPNPFCAFKDSLPEHTWDFVWNSHGILEKTGGWHHSKELYNEIIFGTLSKPKYIALHIQAAVSATAQQVILTHGGDGLTPLDTSATLAQELKLHYPDEYEGFINESKQQKSQIDFTFYNRIYDWSAIVLILGAIICLYRRPNPLLATFFGITALFILCNAFSTACFANVLARLNARDFWILPMLSMGVIIQYLFSLSRSKNRDPQSSQQSINPINRV